MACDSSPITCEWIPVRYGTVSLLLAWSTGLASDDMASMSVQARFKAQIKVPNSHTRYVRAYGRHTRHEPAAQDGTGLQL